jgi:hypothetical protein
MPYKKKYKISANLGTEYLGAFVKLRKPSNSPYRIHTYVRMEKIDWHRWNCHVIWYLKIFRKYVEKNQVWLKSDMNNGYFTWVPMYIYDNTLLN